ncbi:helix-turn-helix domain-containing protein [Paenibacillus sp. 1P07SE]|uniref:helix-turn-helix domain-containing protein n=1 Tax=Paenibacillus sp. 1P07SE TaxID=3132209 RepID=UPI0039A41671
MSLTTMHRLSPYVRVAMNHRLQPGTMIAERMIWDYELLYVKQGTLEIELEHTTYEATAGDVMLFKPGQRHAIRVLGETPVDQPHIHFDLIEQPDSATVPISFRHAREMSHEEKGWFREDLLSGPDMELPWRINLRSITPFEDRLFRIIREYEMQLPFYHARLKGLMLEMLVFLLRDSYTPMPLGADNSIDQLTEIQHYMNTHANREMTLDELAGRFHLSKHRLIQLFKSVYGSTPIHYHQKMRLERGKNMLKFTQLSVQEISDALGFPSIHAFSRAFKNKEGRSPTAYRAAALSSDHRLGQHPQP